MKSPILLLVIAYLGFLSLGLPDSLVGVAWPSLRDDFALQQSAVALVFLGSGCGYFLSGFFAGRLLTLMGIGPLLAGSSALVALSALGYALSPVWPLFASWSLLHGLGSGAIDTGLNHYAAHHFSARHMNWLHAFYTLGATLGPAIMIAVFAADGMWRTGYLTVAAMLLCLSLLFAFTTRSWEKRGNGAVEPKQTEQVAVGTMEALGHSAVWLQIALFFFYTGVEVTLGQWSFTLLTEWRGAAKETAGACVTVYWGSICAGRVLFGYFVERIGIDLLLRLSMATSLLGSLLLALADSGWMSGFALSVAGFGLASIYPCMMARTPKRLGKALTAHAIGFQVSAATVGAAAVPSLTALLAERFGLENALSCGTVGMTLVVLLLHESLLTRSGNAGR